MSWSTGWSSTIAPPPSPATSSISLRSVQKTSGLFNTGFADDLKSKPSAGILTSIDNGNETSILGLDSGMLSCLDPLAEASLDSFVDLSTFLMEGKEYVPLDGGGSLIDEAADTAVTEIDALLEQTKEKDGTATAASDMMFDFGEVSPSSAVEETEVVDVVDMEEEVVTTAPDHDYVTKRPRLSTSSVASDESGPSSVRSSPYSVEHKYRERRNKNNVASRRSREVRKQKFVEMDSKADELVIENENLRVKIEQLEKLAKEMKATLVNKLAGK